MLIHPKGRAAWIGGAIVLAILGAGAYLAWTVRPPQWYAVVYDDAANRRDYEVVARTHTRAQCSEALRNEFAERRVWGAGGPQVAWECQTNCIVRADRTLECAHRERGLDTLD